MQGFLMDERGSTRLALALGLVAIAMLAAVAVPMVFSQAHNAQDARARENVTRLAKDVEACRVNAGSYRDCDEPVEVPSTDRGRWGRSPGDSGVLTERSTDTAFEAYAVSGNGARVYVWSSRDSQATKHVCTHGSVDRLEREDCDGPPW